MNPEPETPQLWQARTGDCNINEFDFSTGFGPNLVRIGRTRCTDKQGAAIRPA
jgi:hypothetical protein